MVRLFYAQMEGKSDAKIHHMILYTPFTTQKTSYLLRSYIRWRGDLVYENTKRDKHTR